LAKVHSQAYWERELLANVGNKAFNSRLAEIALRGQFQEDYKETREQKVEGKVDVVIDFSGAVNDLIKQLKNADNA
jgi:dihydrodipicolinate reductase